MTVVCVRLLAVLPAMIELFLRGGGGASFVVVFIVVIVVVVEMMGACCCNGWIKCRIAQWMQRLTDSRVESAYSLIIVLTGSYWYH